MEKTEVFVVNGTEWESRAEMKVEIVNGNVLESRAMKVYVTNGTLWDHKADKKVFVTNGSNELWAKLGLKIR